MRGADELDILDTYEGGYDRLLMPVHTSMSPGNPAAQIEGACIIQATFLDSNGLNSTFNVPKFLLAAFVYVKKSTVYRGPPSASYLDAIRLMLEEAGHPVEVDVKYINADDGSIQSI